MQITYKQADEAFTYDSTGGRLLWRAARKGIRPGQQAGFMLNGLRYVTFNGERILVKNIVWLLNTGNLPEKRLYPIDGNQANCRFENLGTVKPKPESKKQRLAVREAADGSLEVVVGGAVVGKSDDPEKLLALIRALLVY